MYELQQKPEIGALRMDVGTKRQNEKDIVELMIKVYCRGKHGNHKELCSDCRGLLEYALKRIDRCPYMETKTFCSACKTHCYSPEMREKIKLVMRYSGPRMLLYHPIMAIRHMLVTLSEKQNE